MLLSADAERFSVSRIQDFSLLLLNIYLPLRYWRYDLNMRSHIRHKVGAEVARTLESWKRGKKIVRRAAESHQGRASKSHQGRADKPHQGRASKTHKGRASKPHKGRASKSHQGGSRTPSAKLYIVPDFPSLDESFHFKFCSWRGFRGRVCVQAG